eukprot:59197_1
MSDFDANLLQTIIASNNDTESIILSPFSIVTAMTLCMLGSANNTLKEMVSTLYPNTKYKQLTFKHASEIALNTFNIHHYYNQKYNQTNRDAVIVKLANKIWISKDYKVNKRYTQTLGKIIDGIGTFNARKPKKTVELINKWCSKNTKKMVQNILSLEDLSDDIGFIIANAIYFNGKFTQPFDTKNTDKNIPFYKDKKRNNEIGKVSMMFSETSHYFKMGYKGKSDLNMVKLDYMSSDMFLLLINDKNI